MIKIKRNLESVNPQSVNCFYHGIINLMCQFEYEKNAQTFQYIFLIDTTRGSHSSLHMHFEQRVQWSLVRVTCESVYARANGLSLIARRRPPIHFDTWSHDPLPWWSHTSPLIIRAQTHWSVRADNEFREIIASYILNYRNSTLIIHYS